jgi:glycosyl-4,4'-diaponeurosporenoate acyltransferase
MVVKMSYVIIITIDMLLIMGINALLAYLDIINSFSVQYALLAPIHNLALILLIESIIAAFIHFVLPSKLFSPYRKRFKVFEWEKKFYESIHIRKWKDIVPDAGQLCNFKKDKLKGTETEYLYKFLVEACYADSIHFWMGIGGFSILFFNINKPIAMLTIALPIAFFSLILNLLPMVIQRYNRPKLLRVYERQLRKEQASE